jgi:hypothetical protein
MQADVRFGSLAPDPTQRQGLLMSAFDPGATKILQRAIGRYVPIVLQSRFALVIKKSKGHRHGFRVNM